MNVSILTRRPEIGSILSLIAVIVFYVVFGGVNLGKLAGAASWVNLAANLGIVALPVGLLMIAGEIDISIGAMIPAGSMTVAILSGHFGLPIGVGIAGALALGLLVGLVNGLIATRTTVPTLIITLGTLMAVQGIILSSAMLLAGNASVSLTPPDWAKTVFGMLIAGKYQVIICWWAGFAAVFYWVLHVSPLGNWIYAMGGDQTSARNAGIPTARLKIALFMLSSTAAAFVGICGAIQFNSAQVSGGMGYIFNTIVSVVVGGVLLTGGFGSVLGILVGTVTFAIVSQGIYFTQIERNWSNLIIGVTLLLAVGMNESFRNFAMRSVRKKPRVRKEIAAGR
ncbi:ABC transporter permease [Novosphingobium sp.]|uniref:ABC transporter permease n=1 Tax=Novosphingobium sp. TaxID=1874826 RepID=UPI0025EEFC08|nr:ABC transporter permease [Novosphingobium sp.]